MRSLLLFVVLSSLSCGDTHSNSGSASASNLLHNRQLFTQSAKYAQYILERYPAKSNILVFMGSSPVPISVFSEFPANKKRVDTRKIPLSEFQGFANSDYELTANEKKVLFSHFKKHLGTRFGKKRVVIVDFASSGSSLRGAHLRISQYLQSLKITPNVLSVPLVVNRSDLGLILFGYEDSGLAARPIVIGNADRRPFGESLKHSWWDTFNPYGRWTVKEPKNYTPRRYSKNYKSLIVAWRIMCADTCPSRSLCACVRRP